MKQTYSIFLFKQSFRTALMQQPGQGYKLSVTFQTQMLTTDQTYYQSEHLIVGQQPVQQPNPEYPYQKNPNNYNSSQIWRNQDDQYQYKQREPRNYPDYHHHQYQYRQTKNEQFKDPAFKQLTQTPRSYLHRVQVPVTWDNPSLNRRWIKQNPNLQNTFRLMSYNILAESLIVWNELQGSEAEHSKWIYRFPMLVEEIKHYSPQVICLQELDANEKPLRTALAELNYEELYIKRTNPEKEDGCGLFVARDRFEIVQQHLLDLSAVHIDEYFFDRPNVAILALLKDKVNQHHVLVINTHLLFNNRRGDIKLLQIQSILAAARTIINGLGAANVSLVWTGDFNLIPNSPIYDYLRTGCLNVSTADIKKASGQDNANLHTRNPSECLKKLHKNISISQQTAKHFTAMKGYNRWLHLFLTIDVVRNHQGLLQITAQKGASNNQQDYQRREVLHSAYGQCHESIYKEKGLLCEMFTEDSTFEPVLTSLSRSTKGTVDYVWYSNFYAKNTRLFVDQVAEVPKAELLIKYHCFPNEHFPSDHISMVVDFGYDK